MSDNNDLLGPLAALAGEWEGSKGLDVSHHHVEGAPGDTPYRETISFKPFGPVDNGRQSLYGLDYRMAAWRIGEDLPFHTEVGYWLWDCDAQQVMRCFVIPRGSVIMAGATVAADATEFTLRALRDTDEYGICQNPYLMANARCTDYVVNISVAGDTFTYDETTTLEMTEYPEPYIHTDRNELRRTAHAELIIPD